jgi:hypothetical protein
MKFVEIRGGFLQPVSNEENIILEMVRGHDGPLPKSSLDERENELARQLTSRGLLTRAKIEDKLYYMVNDLEDLWGR